MQTAQSGTMSSRRGKWIDGVMRRFPGCSRAADGREEGATALGGQAGLLPGHGRRRPHLSPGGHPLPLDLLLLRRFRRPGPIRHRYYRIETMPVLFPASLGIYVLFTQDFPILNLVIFVLLIAVGTDDAFLLHSSFPENLNLNSFYDVFPLIESSNLPSFSVSTTRVPPCS